MHNSHLAWVNQAENRYCINIDDDRYPPLLREIHQPPETLYLWGDIDLLKKPQIAMVGTRHPTASGRQAAFEYARDLAAAGLIISSGLALGIDTNSHQGALTKGSTIAVLGSGLNCIYPKSNQQLAEQIATTGCLVSEFAPDISPRPYHFPQRNRIISGLSLGVFVIEATLKSGSLITARLGLEQNREVFALPGNPFNPQSRGCHQLIKQGAILVDSIADITDELPLNLALSTPTVVQYPNMCANKKQIFMAISHDVTGIDDILAATQLGLGDVSAILIELESEHKILRTLGGYIKQTRR